MHGKILREVEDAFVKLFHRAPDRNLNLYEDVESLGVAELLAHLEDECGLAVPESLTLGDLTSLRTLAAALHRGTENS